MTNVSFRCVDYVCYANVQVAPLKQGCFGIVHCSTVFSPEWEMYWDSLLDNFGSCANDSAATRVSWTGPQLFKTFSVHTNPITRVMFSTKHCVSGRSNSQVYFFGKYSNIPGKALFHDNDHVTFMGWFLVGHHLHILWHPKFYKIYK